jgi:hypothetical protein
MKRLLMATPVVALALLLVSTPDASAFGRRKGHYDDCAPAYAPAPTCVTWVEQTVTAYRTEWKTRQVPVEVSRPVERVEIKKEKRTVIVPTWVTEKSTVTEVVPTWVTEKSTVTESVPTWVTEKSTVTEVVPTWVTEKRTERVVVPTWVKEKQTITEVVPTWVKETRTVRETVPTWVKEKVTRTVWKPEYVKETHYRTVCRPVTSVVHRPVVRCRMVPVACVDPCTGCSYTSCRPETYVEQVPCSVVNYVSEQQPFEVTVNRPRAVQEQVEVNVCKYVTQERPVEVMVCKHVTQSRPVEVNVCKHVTEERPVEVRVCKYVTQQRPVEYQVCKHVSKTEEVDVRYVHVDWKKETVMRTEHYCERVAYQTTVKVPVCVPAPVCDH